MNTLVRALFSAIGEVVEPRTKRGRTRDTVMLDIYHRNEGDSRMDYPVSTLSGLLNLQEQLADHGPDLDEAMNLVVNQSAPLLGVDTVSIQLIEDGRLCHRASTSTARPPPQRIDAVASFLCREALQAGKVLACEDIEADPRVDLAHARSAGIRAVIAAPLRHAGEVVGMLSFHSARPARFRAEDLELARLVAGVAGSEIQRRRVAAELDSTLRFARRTLDALTKHICVIDQDGIIIAVNRAWREFADANNASRHEVSEARNYLEICDAVQGPEAEHAMQFARNARAVLAGTLDQFMLEYPCHAPTEQRWFQVRVSRFDDDGPVRAVVAHENITERKRREEDLRRFRYAMDATIDGVYIIDPVTLRCVDFNSTACQMLGYTREEMLAMVPGETAGVSTSEIARQYREFIASGQTVQTIEQLHRHKNGTCIAVETNRRLVRSEEGSIVVATVRDITQRKQAEERARRHARQQRLIAAFGRHALASTEPEGLFVRASEFACAGLEVAFAALLQLTPDNRSLVLRAGDGWSPNWMGWTTPESDNPILYNHLLETDAPIIVEDFSADGRFVPSSLLAAHGIKSVAEVVIVGASGRFGTLGAYSPEPKYFSPDDIDFLQSIANTVETAIERGRSEEMLAYMSQFDSLTGLPNRHLLRDRLAQTLTQASRNEWQAGVLITDLDHFKTVNETLGNAVGDALLQQFATRLQSCVRSGDTVARLSADEFAIILYNLARPDDAGLVAQKIFETCALPFDAEGKQTYLSASVGVALYPGDGADTDNLLRNADIAMHRAKEKGRNNCQFYLPQMNERSLQRMQTGAALRGALERGEFLLHYQPKADLYTGAICGFEALLRWQHPERGLVPPAEFIAVLEDTGQIVPVGKWVLRTVCRQIAGWQALGLKALPVAVNVSARQFQLEYLETDIRSILLETGIDPQLLELELTESLLMTDAEAAAQTLRSLKSVGVRLAVDDFGTGYSSLAYLKRFPLDCLKIDRAFIRECIADPGDAMIATAVINLAHSLKLKVVAEGVETEAQLNFLRSHGCDQIQGYYFARPLDIAAATKALAEGTLLPGAAYEGDTHRSTLLLVDDNAADLELGELNLAQDGYRILCATSPQAALDVLANNRIDAVISDQSMPRMSGVDFLAAVRTLYPDAIRILMSASDDPEMLPKAVNDAGIHMFLSKHWNGERVRQAVREACRMSLRAGQ